VLSPHTISRHGATERPVKCTVYVLRNITTACNPAPHTQITICLIEAPNPSQRVPHTDMACPCCVGTPQPADLLRMERIVLDVLSFSLAAPSSYTFLHLLAQVGALNL
jgi:hypothetical protein